MRSRVRVKICCIESVSEGRLAVAAGADAVGLVSAMPSGPGVVDEGTIARIARGIPPSIATFLLTSRRDADGISAQQRRCGTNTLQLCDRVPVEIYAQLRACLPGVALVQVVHVVDAASVEEAVAVAPYVDAILLDSGNPGLAVKELGGTGRVHDWSLSRRIVASVAVPVFLAGGLGPDNVVEAITRVRPFGLDVCSGVRTQGRLDRAKLAAFMARVRETA